VSLWVSCAPLHTSGKELDQLGLSEINLNLKHLPPSLYNGKNKLGNSPSNKYRGKFNEFAKLDDPRNLRRRFMLSFNLRKSRVLSKKELTPVA
jgi:hypothetical protein